MKYTASVFCLLAVFWLGNSDHYSLPLLVMGLASIAFVIAVSHRMNLIDHESQPLHLLGRKLPTYYGWLIVNIVRSNLDVVYRIWRGNAAISPSIARLKMLQESDMGKVIFANSITLTPGTVAMDMKDGQVLIHSLTRAGIDELNKGEMNLRVAQLERSD